MPTRPACAAILLFWALAIGELIRRDVLPDYWPSPPPDLRAIAQAEGDAPPTSWDLLVPEGKEERAFRSVGRATTASRRDERGRTVLTGWVAIDSGGLLKGTYFAGVGGEHLDVATTCTIDAAGDLEGFRATVRASGADRDLVAVEGRVRGRTLTVEAVGPDPIRWSKEVPYEPGGLVQNALGPIDRLPGLQVGQHWVTRVISPFGQGLDPFSPGGVVEMTSRVVGKQIIQWDNKFETTLEVVQQMGLFKARTWVRRDGLVLRQEVPMPVVKLILERQPNRAARDRAERAERAARERGRGEGEP